METLAPNIARHQYRTAHAARRSCIRYVFGDYTLDPRRRELRCREALIHLRPKVFDLLAYLLKHRDHVAIKEEPLAHLRPD